MTPISGSGRQPSPQRDGPRSTPLSGNWLSRTPVPANTVSCVSVWTTSPSTATSLRAHQTRHPRVRKGLVSEPSLPWERSGNENRYAGGGICLSATQQGASTSTSVWNVTNHTRLRTAPSQDSILPANKTASTKTREGCPFSRTPLPSGRGIHTDIADAHPPYLDPGQSHTVAHLQQQQLFIRLQSLYVQPHHPSQLSSNLSPPHQHLTINLSPTTVLTFLKQCSHYTSDLLHLLTKSARLPKIGLDLLLKAFLCS